MKIRVILRQVKFKLFDCIRDNDKLTSSCLNSNCCNQGTNNDEYTIVRSPPPHRHKRKKH